MIKLQTTAHAKLNLSLDVVGKRPDGYHNLRMVMQEIELGDDLTVMLETERPWTVETDSQDIPCDDSNLAVRAAYLFFKEAAIDCNGFAVSVKKRIPVCAGMGGGSSDGAAVLRLLYKHYQKPFPEETLYRIAEQVGSDVPFALYGGTALAEEKGQILSRLPSLPECSIVLCKPDFSIATPDLFRAIDRENIKSRPETDRICLALQNGDVSTVAQMMYNVFEPVVSRDHPEIQEIKGVMLSGGAVGASMTGSGPTIFGLFSDSKAATDTYSILKKRYKETYLTRPV